MNETWWQDTQDIPRLVRAVYECISGAAGAPRDWERFRYLQHPQARSLRTVVEADGTTSAKVFDVDSYIADVTPFFALHAFHEVEIEQSGDALRRRRVVAREHNDPRDPGRSQFAERITCIRAQSVAKGEYGPKPPVKRHEHPQHRLVPIASLTVARPAR